MPPIDDDDVNLFLRSALMALVRAELQKKTPARFSSEGQRVWNAFHNELHLGDLLVLAIQDAGAGWPIPFQPQLWWSGFPKWVELAPSAKSTEDALAAIIDTNVGELSRDQYLRAQARLLGVNPPDNQLLDGLPQPQPFERWLELPSTGGWIAYKLCERSGDQLYLWENFTVVCANPREMIMAGIIAYELNAPPNQSIPVYLDDPKLGRTISMRNTYHNVLARRDVYGRFNLSFLQHNNQVPLWI